MGRPARGSGWLDEPHHVLYNASSWRAASVAGGRGGVWRGAGGGGAGGGDRGAGGARVRGGRRQGGAGGAVRAAGDGRGLAGRRVAAARTDRRYQEAGQAVGVRA